MNLQTTDVGFTLADSANANFDGNPNVVFNELSAPTRFGGDQVADARPYTTHLSNYAGANGLGSSKTQTVIHVSDIPNFDQLSDLDRLALAEEIFAAIRDPDSLPSPIAHRVELDRRWASYQVDPSIALTKEQFRKQAASLKR